MIRIFINLSILLRLPKLDVSLGSEKKSNPNILNKKLQINKKQARSIPKELLFELASLPADKYKIEIKSKYMSLTLPPSSLPSSPRSTIDENNDQQMDIENDENFNKYSDDYVLLVCNLNNENKPLLVPPIRIYAPYDYPNSNPIIECIQADDTEDEMLPEYSM
jgi:hypothetical protein